MKTEEIITPETESLLTPEVVKFVKSETFQISRELDSIVKSKSSFNLRRFLN